ncbi:hypothetical protein M5K25_002379 [Dendrobium thyrsiflorum]|uniref:Pentatricopeptide repeat-containing protein n=1 Tax=Dendrobium thyrsiflorum TaxID=117978 RepID=A0ABD0VMK5_DENTH
MVDGYWKNGMVLEARQAFEAMPVKNVIIMSEELPERITGQSSRPDTKMGMKDENKSKELQDIVHLISQVMDKMASMEKASTSSGPISKCDSELGAAEIVEISGLVWNSTEGKNSTVVGKNSVVVGEETTEAFSLEDKRTLRRMSGFSLRDQMRNEYIREKVGVALVVDKIRESRLRWFGLIKHPLSDDPIRRADASDLAYFKKGRASRFLSSNSSVPCLGAFGCPAGWLFLCQRLGFCVDCWGLFLGSSVSLLFLLFRDLCAAVPVTLLACWAAVPRAGLGNLFLAVGLSPSPFLLGCVSNEFLADHAGVFKPDLIPPGEYRLSKPSIARMFIESSLNDLSSKDLCRSIFSFGLSRSRARSRSSSSSAIEQRDATFLMHEVPSMPQPLLPHCTVRYVLNFSEYIIICSILDGDFLRLRPKISKPGIEYRRFES